ncbi:MAG: endonuclease III [Clostridia bacterium]|nr:endonuclease III [Clostridia bacterium]
MRKKEIALSAVERLKKQYPDAVCSLRTSNAFELLVATRLSAQCTDARVNMVTPKLFEKFPTPAAFAAATPEEVEPYIHSCGLYKTKARDLVAMSKQLMERFGGEIPDTLEELVTLAGIGRKTANLVCGDVFGMPGAVVTDTHCIRIANRLGLCDTTDPRRVENALRDLLPPEESNAFCHRIVLFGREFCTARSPQCDNCPLNDICQKN